jgi:phosphocarrier protein
LESTRLEIEVTIVNRQGLHARPAAQFVRVAGQFPDVEITVDKEGMAVNGKSIMGMLMLEACQGTKLRLTAEGDGAEEAAQALRDLVESGFGEEKKG